MTSRRFRPLWVLALVLAALPAAAAADTETLEVRDFRLRKNAGDQAVVTLERLGTLHVRVRTREPSTTVPVALILEGPDGLRVEKKGTSPLRLHYVVENAERLGTWRAAVHNVGNLGLVSGRFLVTFEPAEADTPGTAPVAASPPPAARPLTDGKVSSAEDRQKIRAVCRDKNRDVSIRLDLADGSGAYYMSYHRVFRLSARPVSDGVIAVSGDGGEPLHLDTRRRVLYFPSGEKAVFCKVRIYYGAT